MNEIERKAIYDIHRIKGYNAYSVEEVNKMLLTVLNEYTYKKSGKALNAVNNYFIELQNKVALTNPDERAWKLVSKILNELKNEC